MSKGYVRIDGELVVIIICPVCNAWLGRVDDSPNLAEGTWCNDCWKKAMEKHKEEIESKLDE